MTNPRVLGLVALGAITWLTSNLEAQTVPEAGPIGTLAIEELPSRLTKPVVSGLALDPTGHFLAAAGDDHVVRVWDAQTGTLLHRLTGHNGWIRACAFSPTGEQLATAGQDREILLWDSSTGRQVRRFPPAPAALATVLFSPDGRMLAAGGFEPRLRLYDVASGQLLRTVEAAGRDVRALAFSANGQLLAAAGGGGQIRIVALDGSINPYDLPGDGRTVDALAFRADGARLASAGEGQEICLWDLTNGSLGGTLPARPGKIMALTYGGPDQLIAGGSFNTIRIFHPEAGGETLRLVGHTGSVSSLVFDPASGRLISGSFDTTVRFWTTGP